MQIHYPFIYFVFVFILFLFLFCFCFYFVYSSNLAVFKIKSFLNNCKSAFVVSNSL